MADYVMQWSSDQKTLEVLDKRIIVTEANEDAALLKGMCVIMQEISKISEKIICESKMEEGAVTIRVYVREPKARKLLCEIRNVRAKKVWIV